MKISERAKRRFIDLIECDEVKNQLMVHGSPPRCATFSEDGRITLYGTTPLWFARLIRKTETSNIESILLRITDIITGVGGAKDENLYANLSIEICNKAIREGDYDMAIDAVYDTINYFSKSSMSSKYLNIASDTHTRKVKVTVAGREISNEHVILNIPINNSGDTFPIAFELNKRYDMR